MLSVLSIGCGTQPQSTDKAVVIEEEKTSAEQISKEPDTISEEAPEEPKPESSKPSEPTSNNLTVESTDKQKSSNVEQNQTKAQVTQPAKNPQRSGDQVLGATDPNVSGLPDYFNIQAPLSYSVHPKKNLTIKWEKSAPNFFLYIRDMSNVDMKSIFSAYVGNVNSYTIPANLLTEGHKYGISLYATSGTDRSDPNYKQRSSSNMEQVIYGRSVTIHTLTPPIITSPQNASDLPKADVILKWAKTGWVDNNNLPIVRYKIEVADSTANKPIFYEETPQDSVTIEGSKLISGHSYSVKVTAVILPYTYEATAIADNTKSTIITFIVK